MKFKKCLVWTYCGALAELIMEDYSKHAEGTGGHTLKKQGRPQETIQCLQKALGVTWWQPAEDLGLGYTPVGDLLVQEEGWLTPPSLPPPGCCNCLPSTSICTSRAAQQLQQQQQQQQCLRFSVPQTGRLLHDSAENYGY